MEPVHDRTNAESTDEPAPSAWASVRDDFGSSTGRQRVLLVATVGWIVYEWGFGNETVTPWILVQVVAATSGAWSVVAAAAVGFAFTLAQQLVSGFTAVYGFAMFRRTALAAELALRSRLNRDPQGWDRRGLLTRALIVYSLGTTAVVLIESTATGAVDPARQRAVAVRGAVLCATIVGVLAALLATGVVVGRTVSWLVGPTEWLLRVLGNPLFWIGLLVIVLASNAVRRRVGR
jgi:hypothetical protein